MSITIAHTEEPLKNALPQSAAGAEKVGENGYGDSRLDNTRTMFPPPSLDVRKNRFVARAQSQKWLIAQELKERFPAGIDLKEVNFRPRRLSRCSWTIGSTVAIESTASGAHYSNIEQCSSIWSCPCCAPIIRSERAREISKAVEAHEKAGGELLFATFTIRHNREMALSESLDTAIEAWRRAIQGAPYQRIKDRYGISGYIRSVEITYGQANGWHPHIHAIFFLERYLEDVEIDVLGEWLHGRWSTFAYEKTGLMPDRRTGFDIQRVDKKGRVLSAYISKVSETSKWDIAAELTRGDLKNAHEKSDRYKPFDLLNSDCSLVDEQRYCLWVEYADATFNRRAITWSRGLKKRYSVAEKDDEEVVKEQVSGSKVWVLWSKDYAQIRRSAPAKLAQALTYAEVEDWVSLESILPAACVLILPDTEGPPLPGGRQRHSQNDE